MFCDTNDVSWTYSKPYGEHTNLTLAFLFIGDDMNFMITYKVRIRIVDHATFMYLTNNFEANFFYKFQYTLLQ